MCMPLHNIKFTYDQSFECFFMFQTPDLEIETPSEISPPFKKIMSNRPLQVYQDLQQVPHRVIASRLKVRLKLCLK